MISQRLSLRGKLLAISTILAIFVLSVGISGWLTLRSVTEKYLHVAEINLGNSDALSEMRFDSSEANRLGLRMTLIGVTREQIAEYKKRMLEKIDRFEVLEKKYVEIPFAAGEEVLFMEVKKNWERMREQLKELANLIESKDLEARARVLVIHQSELTQSKEDLDQSLQDLITFQNKEAAHWVSDAKATAQFGNTFSFLMSVIGFALSLGIGSIFATRLTEILLNIARKIGTGADQVSSAAQEVASSSEELSSSATEQAASLEQTASAIEEMNATVNRNAESASRSQHLSESGHTEALKGKEAVSQMIRAIEEINRSNSEMMNQIEESNREISEIVKVISEIGNKTKVINDIVFQTKLLSFNASVEAARAGEHGKGFSVVAEEVGSLAQMSGNAAKEITNMLDSSIQKVEGIVSQTKVKIDRFMDAGREKVETGTVVAHKCGEILDSIVKRVDEIHHVANEISTSSREQAQGVQEITKAMSQLDQVTQQNATASNQASAAAEQMSVQANVLRETVQTLLRTVQGQGTVKIENVPAGNDPRFEAEAA